MSNPVLGVLVCSGCGGQATVKQTKRRGQYLYSHCAECGIDQRTGKQVQNSIWHGCEWKTGVDAMQHRPANITDDWQPETSSPAPLLDDWQPEDESQTEPVAVSKSVKKGSGRALLALSAIGFVLVSVMRVIK